MRFTFPELPSSLRIPALPISDRTKKILLYGVAYPSFFFFWLSCGAYWTFPYDHLRDYIVQEAERDGTRQLEITSLGPSWLTGVEVEGVRLASVSTDPERPPAALVIREATARVSLLSYLFGTTDVSFDAELDGGGTIEGEFATDEESTHIEAELENVDLRRLGPVHEMIGLPLAGMATGSIDLTIAQQAADTAGTMDITVRNLSLGDGRTPLVIEGLGTGLTLERMNLGTLQLRMQTERGIGRIEALRADGTHAELRGTGSIRLTQPLRMSSMDMLIRMKFKDAYRQSSDRMRALFSLLELNPQVRPARTPDGGFQWRIQGSFAGRIRMVPSGSAPMPGAR